LIFSLLHLLYHFVRVVITPPLGGVGERSEPVGGELSFAPTALLTASPAPLRGLALRLSSLGRVKRDSKNTIIPSYTTKHGYAAYYTHLYSFVKKYLANAEIWRYTKI
jgi:hypothetical protein